MSNPPLSPINTQLSTGRRSPTLSFRSHARRKSSLSSNHDRSPTTPRSRHRFSQSSRLSAEFRTPVELEDGFDGTGNLADELDQLDDEDDYDDLPEEQDMELKAAQDAIRDSGIDVSYAENTGTPDVAKQQTIREETELEDQLPPGLEDAADDLSRLCSTSKVDTEQTTPSFVRRVQDLGNQSAIESGVQRLNTSANSMSSHLEKETKALQTLSASFLPPFGSSMLNLEILEGITPLMDDLTAALPIPDSRPLETLQKLSSETDNVVQTLASLLDTLQMSKQTSNAASRHLRTTQTIVTELRRERERADDARFALSQSNSESKIQARWAAQQCQDVVSGFSNVCDALQQDLSKALQVSA